MPADLTDKFDDVATTLTALVEMTDELAQDPPPSLNPTTLQDFQRALADASRVLAELEEQFESNGGVGQSAD